MSSSNSLILSFRSLQQKASSNPQGLAYVRGVRRGRSRLIRSGEVTELLCILAVDCSLNGICHRYVTGSIDWQVTQTHAWFLTRVTGWCMEFGCVSGNSTSAYSRWLGLISCYLFQPSVRSGSVYSVAHGFLQFS